MFQVDLMPDVPTHRVVWSGLFWLAAATLWIRTALWIDRDARAEFSSSMPWSLLLAMWGPCLLAAPALVGWSGFLALLLIPCLVAAAYVWRRDTRAAHEERVFVSADMERAVRNAASFGALRGALAADGPSPKSDAAIRVTPADHDGESAPPRRRRLRARAVARAIKTAQPIFAKAFACRARAVVLEPKRGRRVDVLYHVDGVLKPLQPVKSLPHPDGALLTAAIRTLAGMKPDDALRPQAGTFGIELAAEQRTVAASTHPSQFGHTVELKLQGEPLAGGHYRDGLAAIGLPWRECEAMQKLLAQPRGMILISGPSQSGRTTTAYAAISELSPLHRSVATIEEPVEERLPFAIQSPVMPQAYRTFPNVLRAVLLQHPHVVFVGETHDRETAEIAMHAATDTLMITTIQAEDASSSLIKLLELGIDPAFVRESVTAVLSQRLARRLCTFCKKPYPPPPDFRKKLGPQASGDVTIYRRGRCDACHRIGYRGLLPVTELLLMNDGIRDLLGDRPGSRRIRKQARHSGMRTLRESAIELVRNGATSISEVVRVVP